MRIPAIAAAIAVACLVHVSPCAAKSTAAQSNAVHAGFDLLTADERTPLPAGTLPYLAPLLRPPMTDQLGTKDSFDAAYGYAQNGAFPRLRVLPWIAFGAGLVTVDYEPKPRVGGTLSFELEGLRSVMFFERAYGRLWHRVETSYQISPALRIGAIDDTFAGSGPRIEAIDYQTHIAVIGTTLFAPKSASPNGIISLRIPF